MKTEKALWMGSEGSPRGINIIDNYYSIFKKILMSCIIWLIGSIVIVPLFLSLLFFAIILYPFDKMRKVPQIHTFLWADLLTALNPYWDIKISGLSNIDRTKTYVIVANHKSIIDIILIYKTKMQFKWVANERLFNIPVVGWAMRLTRHIKLKKGKLGSIRRSYKEAAYWLKRGMSVSIFPEGTRSNLSATKEFKNGAFKLAIKEQIPILPISIKGSGNVIPKGDWLFTVNIPVTMKVLAPIDTAGFSFSDFERLKDLVRREIDKA